MPERLTTQSRRITIGERIILLSDGVLNRPKRVGGILGLDGIRETIRKAPNESAAGTLRAIEDAARESVDDPLDDDATVVVLVPGRSSEG